jgi:Tfp pilus assembly protein PilW
MAQTQALSIDTVWLSIVRSIVRTALVITGLSKQHSVAATAAEGVTRLLEVARENTPARKQLVDAVDVLFKAEADSRVTLDSQMGS